MNNTIYEFISYDKDKIERHEELDLDFLAQNPENQINWVDINSLSDKEGIERLANKLDIHHLIIEDILNTNQMVKIDNYDDCVFLVLKMLKYDALNTNISAEHVSIILKKNTVISFRENSENIFAVVKEKIISGRDNIQKFGADYLCYELINAVVNNYFNIIDALGDTTDDIEEELISNPVKITLQKIYFVKRELMYLRKSVYPLRELIGGLANNESALIGSDIKIYLRDVYDHLIQIVDSIETYQDILSNMLDTYLSSVSNKTNDTMKILTIFSTIFIPLTFLAGIYGMNFKNIPELSFGYGYLMFWIVSVIIALLMLLFFHKKKWF